MTARELDEQAGRLSGKRRRIFESLPLALVCGALAPLLWTLSTHLGLALAVGAGVQLALATSAFFARRLLLERLATDPVSHRIPEVRAYCLRLARPDVRRKLARSIRRMVADVFRPKTHLRSLYLADRVYAYARDLDAIARDLVSPAVRVDPVSVARCNWLLTQAADNPLFDRRLPAEDLGVILRRIRAGMVSTS